MRLNGLIKKERFQRNICRKLKAQPHSLCKQKASQTTYKRYLWGLAWCRWPDLNCPNWLFQHFANCLKWLFCVALRQVTSIWLCCFFVLFCSFKDQIKTKRYGVSLPYFITFLKAEIIYSTSSNPLFFWSSIVTYSLKFSFVSSESGSSKLKSE